MTKPAAERSNAGGNPGNHLNIMQDQPDMEQATAAEPYPLDNDVQVPEMEYWRTHSIELSAMDKILSREKIIHVVSMFFDFVGPTFVTQIYR